MRFGPYEWNDMTLFSLSPAGTDLNPSPLSAPPPVTGSHQIIVRWSIARIAFVSRSYRGCRCFRSV
jgi:hypothetical protein